MTTWILGLILIAATGAMAEICPEWHSITVTTVDPESTITIKASEDKNQITKLTVIIGTNRMEVPQDSLKDTAYPQLSTLLMGYWMRDLKTFYVSLDCGRLNSFPHGKQPQTLWFYFSNGEFSRVERRSAIQRREQLTEPAGGAYVSPATGDPSAHP